MPDSSYQEYLLTHQYKNAQNLNARIQLHERFSTNKYGWQRWVFDRTAPVPQPTSRTRPMSSGPTKALTARLTPE